MIKIFIIHMDWAANPHKFIRSKIFPVAFGGISGDCLFEALVGINLGIDFSTIISYILLFCVGAFIGCEGWKKNEFILMALIRLVSIEGIVFRTYGSTFWTTFIGYLVMVVTFAAPFIISSLSNKK